MSPEAVRAVTPVIDPVSVTPSPWMSSPPEMSAPPDCTVRLLLEVIVPEPVVTNAPDVVMSPEASSVVTPEIAPALVTPSPPLSSPPDTDAPPVTVRPEVAVTVPDAVTAPVVDTVPLASIVVIPVIAPALVIPSELRSIPPLHSRAARTPR